MQSQNDPDGNTTRVLFSSKCPACGGINLSIDKDCKHCGVNIDECEAPAAPPGNGKRTVKAKALAHDIKSGMSYEAIRMKYMLTEKDLDKVFKKLLEAKLVKPREIPKRSPTVPNDSLPQVRKLQKPKAVKPPKVNDNLPWLFVAIEYLGDFCAWMLASPTQPSLPFFISALLWVVGRGILYSDRNKLSEVGYDTSRLNVWWFLFSPFYLERRAKLTKGSWGPFALDFLIFVASFAVFISILMLGMAIAS